MKLKKIILPPFCECGCGKRTTWNKRKKEWNRRLCGHHERTPEIRKKMSSFQKERGFFSKYNKTEEHSKKVIKSNQTRTVTEETKRKISNTLLGGTQSKKSNLKRHITQIDKKCSRGEKNGMWRGGTSTYTNTGEWNKLREEIKKRDNYTCQKCGSKKFPVAHHIDFTKDNHEPLNLITLCKSCHIRTHIKHKKEK